LTVEEKNRLLGVIKDSRDRAIFMLMYFHGLRASEPGRLKYSDYNQGSTLNLDRIYLRRAKDSISGECPVVPAAAQAIRSWIRKRGHGEGPLFITREKTAISRKRVFFLMRRYAELAEIPLRKAHPHVLKHSTVTHLLADKHETIVDAQRHVGHAAISSTMRYVNLGGVFDEARIRRLAEWR
jgi:type 1 fimbriae regulatory protein FimB